MRTDPIKEIHPLLQKIIRRLEQSGAGEVVVAEDGHVFFQPSVHIEHLWGAADMKMEGKEAGLHVVIRRVRNRGKRCKYAGMPWYQIYVLPIVEKNAQTMTDKERRNMELNAQALRMAHAVERDEDQAAVYRELHEAHKKNPEGYKKLYPNFFGFLVATFRMQLAAQEAEELSRLSELRQDSAQLALDRSGDEVVPGLRGVNTVHAEVGQVVAVVQERRSDIQHGHTLLIPNLIDRKAVHVMVVADALLMTPQPRKHVAGIVLAHVAGDELIKPLVINKRQGEQNRAAAQLADARNKVAVLLPERGKLGHRVVGIVRRRSDVRPAEVGVVASELHQRDVAGSNGLGMLLGNLSAA